MKTSQLLCIALAIALSIVSWRLVKAGSEQADTSATTENAAGDNAAYNCIMTRASCRSYSATRPSEAQIDSLLRAAMAAPTARDQRPWEIIVVTDRDILDSIAAHCQNIKMAAEAPLAFIICGNTRLEEGKDQFWPQDLSAATENLLLAAHSMGLGGVWCGIYPDPERVKFISKLTELPDSIVPLNVVPVGYPKARLTPKDKFNSEQVHYNTY